MSCAALEAYLARLYTDVALRERFLADPQVEARRAGLDESEALALVNIDKAGLCMAAASYAHKREQRCKPRLRLWEFFSRWQDRS